jgi:Ca-activated chloride channel family protein
VDEVVLLAKRFGIVTPYTSYLVIQDPVLETGGGRDKMLRELRKGNGMGWGTNAPPSEKPRLAQDAKRVAEAEKAEGAYDLSRAADDEFRAQGRGDSSMQVMRYIGSKTFFRSNGTWYDSSYDPAKHKDLRVVKVNSDEYFKLLSEKEGLAKYLALTEVVVQFEGTWYKFEK